MALTVRFLTSDDAGPWRALWQRSGRWLGHQWEYQEAASPEAAPLRAGVFDDQGRLLAGAAFIPRQRRGQAQWRSPRPASFAGAMLNLEDYRESRLAEALEAIGRFVQQHATAAELTFPPGFQDVRGLAWAGFLARAHYNYTNEIDGVGALLAQAENGARRAAGKVRQALVLVEGKEHARDLAALWEETRRRQELGADLPWRSYEALLERPEAALLGVRPTGGGPLLAGGIWLADTQRVYYALGASGHRDHPLANGAADLLHGLVTDHFFEKRSAPYTYDWVGANTRGVVQFKRKFRPQLELLLRCTWHHPVKGWLARV